MIVSSSTDLYKWALYGFLKKRGVEIPRSEDFQAIGRLSPLTKDLIGVVGYNGFCGQVCSMHMAGDGNWINRQLLWAAFDYPFNQAKCVQVFATVAETNYKALKLNLHLGFKTIGLVPNGWAEGVNLILLTMNKRDCRWLEKKHELKVA